MSREIDDVLAFLDRFQGGVAMPGDAVMDRALRERLERFADGKASEEEREEICEMLRANPTLLRWVAERVKDRRAE